MKQKFRLPKKARYFLYTLLTCVLCVGCGLKSDIKAVTQKQNTIDSLNIEFDKAHEMCKYYTSKYDGYSQMDTFWHYRTKSNIEVDKMIKINNEIMRVRNAR